jgi:hypothetical protein
MIFLNSSSLPYFKLLGRFFKSHIVINNFLIYINSPLKAALLYLTKNGNKI